MYCPPESGNIDPNSAKAKQAHNEIKAPKTQTSRNRTGCGSGPAMSLAVKNMEDPMMPLTSSSTESRRPSPRTSVGFFSEDLNSSAESNGNTGMGSIYPIPSSSGDSNGVPQRRQMTAEQSPHVRGSFTSSAQLGQ